MKKTRVDDAVDALYEIIQSDDFKEGDKIPSEIELVRRIGIGRSTLREAIKLLESKGVIKVRRGIGTFILNKKGVGEDPLGLSNIKDKLKLAKDLLEVRFMIEPKIAMLAAMNATEEEVLEIEHLCNRVEECIVQNKEHMRLDVEFHEAIAKSSKNEVIAQLIPIINNSIYVFTDVTNYVLKRETIETHREIFEAIKNRLPNEAADAMYLHLVYNRKNIHKLINKNK